MAATILGSFRVMNDPFKLLSIGSGFDYKRFKDDIVSLNTATEKSTITHDISHGNKVRIYGSESETVKSITSFSALNQKKSNPLPSYVMENMQKAGITIPSAIQMNAIPTLLSGRDVIACAPTGSGKTLAFLLPIIMRLNQKNPPSGFACIITPTKELAKQISNILEELIKKSPHSKGNPPIKKDYQRLPSFIHLTKSKLAGLKSNFEQLKTFDIIISTPLTLIQGVESKIISLEKTELLIFDEADKLLEQGFLEQSDLILTACSCPKIVKGLFSATISSGVETLANTFMRDPLRIVVGVKNACTSNIEQKLIYVGDDTLQGKMLAIKQLFSEGKARAPVLIFVDSIENSKSLLKDLSLEMPNLSINAINSEKSSTQQETIINNFRSGKLHALIATEILGRGMDFKALACVINYDFPLTLASYLHRIGRTGRAGRKGFAFTLFTTNDVKLLRTVAISMRESGCEVPEWMLSLKKERRHRKKSKQRRITKKEAK